MVAYGQFCPVSKAAEVVAEARLDAQRGLVGARKTALKYSAASAFLCLGEIAMAEGDPFGAGQRIPEALDIFEQVGN